MWCAVNCWAKSLLFYCLQNMPVVNKRQQVSNLIDDTWFMAFPPPPHGPPTSRPPKWVPDVGIVMRECLYICLYLSVWRQEMKWGPEECFEDVMLSQRPSPSWSVRVRFRALSLPPSLSLCMRELCEKDIKGNFNRLYVHITIPTIYSVG